MFEQDNDGLLFNIDTIYIILWVSKDADGEVWDEYPVFRLGFFTDEQEVEKKVEELNNSLPKTFVPKAEETGSYCYKAVKQARGTK